MEPMSVDVNAVLANMRATIGQLHQDLAIERATNDALRAQLKDNDDGIPA